MAKTLMLIMARKIIKKDVKESKIANIHIRIEESEKHEWENHIKEQNYPSISHFIRVAAKELMKREKAMANNMIPQIQKEMLDFAKETVRLLKEELLREASSPRMK